MKRLFEEIRKLKFIYLFKILYLENTNFLLEIVLYFIIIKKF